MTTEKKTIVTIDASCFTHGPGDLVAEGEALGLFRSRRVSSPFRAKIESVVSDSDEHALRVVLTEAP
jgi:hypothetical protein